MSSEPRISRNYLVEMPTAEALQLAGVGHDWPASPEILCIDALREWLYGVQQRRSNSVPVAKIAADLTAILSLVPVTGPVRGPFSPHRGRPPLPGKVEYVGGGAVRLDPAAISSLAGLPPDDDFHVTSTDAGPVLTVGKARYLARPEDPEPRR